MNLKTCILCLAVPFVVSGAETLKLESAVDPKGLFTDAVPLKFVLTLDAPAEKARVDFHVMPEQDLQLNGKSSLELTASPDRKSFSGEIREIRSYYGSNLLRGWIYSPGKIGFTPVITRNGREIRLPAVKLPWRMGLRQDVQLANGVLKGGGKFGDALSFDGKEAMAAVQRTMFNPDSGCIELWVFLPLVLSKNEGIVFFIQPRDGSPWSYHQLTVPANTRKLRYTVFSSDRQSSSVTTAKDIDAEDFIHVMACWNAASQKMELFVNGESAGTAKYPKASGGHKSELTLGGRIHYSKEGIRFISNSQIAVDELRITDGPRENAVPSGAFEPDDKTLLLLHFDGGDSLRDSGRCKNY